MMKGSKPSEDASAADVATFAVAMMSVLDKSESVVKQVFWCDAFHLILFIIVYKDMVMIFYLVCRDIKWFSIC